MYRYKIGYGSHEDSCCSELEHEKLFTQDELTEMIGKAVVEILKENQERDAGFFNWFSDLFMRLKSPNTILADQLISMFGFKAIEYDMQWWVWGWSSLFVKDTWEDHQSEDSMETINKIVDMVQAEGLEAYVDPNEDAKNALVKGIVQLDKMKKRIEEGNDISGWWSEFRSFYNLCSLVQSKFEEEVEPEPAMHDMFDKDGNITGRIRGGNHCVYCPLYVYKDEENKIKWCHNGSAFNPVDKSFYDMMIVKALNTRDYSIDSEENKVTYEEIKVMLEELKEKLRSVYAEDY